MHMELKKFYTGQIATTAKTTVYTVPEKNGPSVIKEMLIHNTDSAHTVIVNIYFSGFEFIREKVEPGGILYVGDDWHTVLNPGEKVEIICSRAAVINVHLSGSETYPAKIESNL